MTRRLLAVIPLAVLISWPATAAAQLSTPPPGVTAETESWYVSGAPISLAGTLYYPSGPVAHFSRNEMVFTGMFDRVPVYRRTTQEPGSVLYVPLAGGLVRPYERRRSGELAGTVGSSAPSFPVVLPAADAMQSASGPAFFGAATPVIPRPVGTTGFLYGTPDPSPRPVATIDTSVPAAAGTVGFTVDTPALASPIHSGPARIETARPPVGLNSVFIDYRELRWHATGPAIEFSPDRFVRTGDYRGFAVYEERGRQGRIYVSTLAGEPALVVPYESRQ